MVEEKFEIKEKVKEYDKQIITKINSGTLNCIKNIAKEHKLSVSELVRQMLLFAISRYEIKETHEETIEANDGISDNKELEEVPALQGQEPTLD